jgi:hypothetical protein
VIEAVLSYLDNNYFSGPKAQYKHTFSIIMKLADILNVLLLQEKL